MKKLLIAVSMLFAVNGNVAADGNDLYDFCTSKKDYQSGLCTGYLAGVYHSLLMQTEEANEPLDVMNAADTSILNQDEKIRYIINMGFIISNISCIPNGIQPQQIRDVVIKWLKENPEKRHLSQYTVVDAAYKEAWPCPKEDE